METLSRMMLAVAACAAAGFGVTGAPAVEQKEVIIGGMCDRTGPTQVNGAGICPGIQDYFDLINSKGGVEGYKIKYEEDRSRI
jgi:branched-chain amino acid transport system substrate-binding protein